MRWRSRREGRSSGAAAVEFALVAPVLIMAFLMTADVGFAIHRSFEVDQTLRNGAQAALQDPGAGVVDTVLAAVSTSTQAGAKTTWNVDRFCACPESTGSKTACATTCTGNRPTAIFYAISGSQAYPGIVLPARTLTRSASVRVR